MMKKQYGKRSLAWLLVLTVVISTIPFMVAPVANAAQTEGTVEYINSKEDLVSFSQRTKSDSYYNKTVVLTADIAFDGMTANNFTPINSFKGTFDGQGHTISGVIISGSFYAGLFSDASGATIKNLTVANSKIINADSFGDCCGAIVGLGNETTIINCHSKNNYINGRDETGGIAGIAGNVTSCTSIGDTIISEHDVGGIVGFGKKIVNCGTASSITGNGGVVCELGGIAGEAYEIQNCYSASTMTATSDNPDRWSALGSVRNLINNTYYLSGSASANYLSCIGFSATAINAPRVMTAQEMASQSFVDTLNQCVGDNRDWFYWEIRNDSVYPQIELLRDISLATATLSSGEIVYTGAEIKPDVQVLYGTEVLKEGDDYTLTYSNNINAGTGAVQISGTGRYAGTLTQSFVIQKAKPDFSILNAKITCVTGGVYPLQIDNSKLNETCTYSFASLNTKIATVTEGGVILAKAPGVVKITVTYPESANYLSLQKLVTVTVKPASVALKKKLKKKALHITWKKIHNISGYEVQMAKTGTSLKKAKVHKLKAGAKSFTSKKVRSGYYYNVRVRAYKKVKVNGKSKTLYSTWMKVSVYVR